MFKPAPFDWTNYGDVNFLDYGGCLIRFDGSSFDVIEVTGDCDSEQGMIVSHAWICWNEIFNEDGTFTSRGRNVAEYADANAPEKVIWIVAGWISYYGGDEPFIHCKNKTELRKELRSYGLSEEFIKSIRSHYKG